ncbi:MAG TPA: hypothetical protein VEK79_12700 [Thermoanaerobaculia bacterium]|nr:hypothetical protein [Thermoanaerobaculia bacterium]
MDLALAAMAGIAVLWVPGAIATRVLSLRGSDGVIRFAREIALGLSFWPILFLFTTLVGWSWSGTSARILFTVLVIALIAIVARRRAELRAPDAVERVAIALMAIVTFTRVKQIENVILPLWVDSVHHTMIVRLLVDHGRLPDSYAPFIPESTFYYHWGFHAVAAFVAWISRLVSSSEMPRVVLAFGQLLNVLTFPALYCGAAVLLRNRRAALLAGMLATLVSIFPAYYVSWGRYTQLAGLLILPPLAASFWSLGRHPRMRRAMELTMLAAGLLLVHARVTVVFAVLAAILAAMLIAERKWRGVTWCGAAGATALLIASPWMVTLLRAPQVRMIVAPAAEERPRWETSNATPDDLVWVPHNTFLFGLASGGLLGVAPFRLGLAARLAAIGWWVLLVVLLQRRAMRKRRAVDRRDRWRIGIIVLWVLMTALLVNLDRFGLPRMRVVTNSAAVIMLFVPLSIAGAHLLRWVADEIVPMSRRRAITLAAALLIGVVGASRLLHIVNPATVLATDADLRALEWIRAATPAGARFAVGVQPWIGGSYIGIDGGYWIPLIAGRESILPPGLYPWVMPHDRVASITDFLAAWYQSAQTADAAVFDTLRTRGVTHLYFGERNTTPLRTIAAGSPRLARIYSADGVEIFMLRGAYLSP